MSTAKTAYPGSPEQHGAEDPERVAFLQDDLRISRGEWNDLADRLAYGLRQIGISANQRVAVRTTTRYEWFVIHAALSKIGAAMVAINARATRDEIAYLLEDSEPTAFILDDPEPDDILSAWPRAGSAPLVTFGRPSSFGGAVYETLVAEPVRERFHAASPAEMIVYTSGTTGRPKGVARNRQMLEQNAEALQALERHRVAMMPMSETTRGMLMHPMHHLAGAQTCLQILRGGGSVVVQRRFDPEATLALIQRHCVTFVMAVPTMLHRIRALPKQVTDAYDRSCLKMMLVGAAAVPFPLKLWIAEFFPSCAVIDGYGTSEVGMLSYLLADEQLSRPGSVGRIQPHVEVKIIGEDGQILGPGEVGEICAKTPSMIDRYLNRPPMGADDMTADGFYRTGDGGYIDADGYLYLTDRMKDFVVSGGTNIYPAEIESVLIAHPAVIDAAIIGVPNEEFGEELLAFCELRPGEDPSEAELIEFCRTKLAGYKVPRRFEFVPNLPRNAAGKVTKNVLRGPFWEGRERRV